MLDGSPDGLKEGDLLWFQVHARQHQVDAIYMTIPAKRLVIVLLLVSHYVCTC